MMNDIQRAEALRAIILVYLRSTGLPQPQGTERWDNLMHIQPPTCSENEEANAPAETSPVISDILTVPTFHSKSAVTPDLAVRQRTCVRYKLLIHKTRTTHE